MIFSGKLLLKTALLGLILIPFVSSGQPGKETIYLSGTGNMNTVPWEFYCTGGRNSGYWTTIGVPSCWEQQGFGTYNYGRDYVTYGRDYQYADETGHYRHRFYIPESWKGKIVFIVFEGSMTDTEVYVNGQFAGDKHQGSFYRFQYDITDRLLYDQENFLEVTVHKMSADESVNRAERYADYWIFGGIFRPVHLEAYPQEYIRHLAITAEADGSFSADVFLKNVESDTEVKTEIIDSRGKLAGVCSKRAERSDSLVQITYVLDNPMLWTAETPVLYTARVSLVKGNEILYQTSEKFGFRTVEIRPQDGIYLNGVKIKMKGINRHCFWPETGRTLNREIDLMDVTLVKDMNMNAVRTSHYPPDKSFLELCDSLGLYVIDELAGWQNAYSTMVGKKLVKEMVQRDLNHPSVIFWSNGNEGGTNRELDDDFLVYDRSGRRVIHAHHRPGNFFNHIETNHYESYESTRNILQDTLIYMTTEFLHCQNDGGGGAGLQDYWELMYASGLSAGGFLWALLDEGVVRTDMDDAIDVNLVNAPDGVLGPHREKEGSFYAIKEIFSPVKIAVEKLPENFNGDLPVENRYHFTNLDKCTFQWQIINFRLPSDSQSGYIMKNQGMLPGIHLDPGMKGLLHIPLPEDWKNADALLLNAFDQDGREIMTWSWKIRQPVQFLKEELTAKSASDVEVTQSDTTITMGANGIIITLDLRSGYISEVKNNQRRLIAFRNGPQLCEGNASVEKVTHYRDQGACIVEVSYNGDMKTVQWKMYPGGWLEMRYQYQLTGSYDYLGISFDYEEGNIISVKWLGKGPYRVWKNRMQGGTLNVWEKAYNNTVTGTYPWLYPEFKGYYAEVNWLELNTVEGKILIVCPEDDLFIRLFDFYGFPPPTLYPELPPGDLSFLDGIPAIGTKMSTGMNAQPESLGPGSEKNSVDQVFTRTLFFNFGIIQ